MYVLILVETSKGERKVSSFQESWVHNKGKDGKEAKNRKKRKHIFFQTDHSSGKIT